MPKDTRPANGGMPRSLAGRISDSVSDYWAHLWEDKGTKRGYSTVLATALGVALLYGGCEGYKAKSTISKSEVLYAKGQSATKKDAEERKTKEAERLKDAAERSKNAAESAKLAAEKRAREAEEKNNQFIAKYISTNINIQQLGNCNPNVLYKLKFSIGKDASGHSFEYSETEQKGALQANPNNVTHCAAGYLVRDHVKKTLNNADLESKISSARKLSLSGSLIMMIGKDFNEAYAISDENKEASRNYFLKFTGR